MSQPGQLKSTVLKKYGNRRYYDSSRRRHLSLKEIHALVREGCEVTVIDAKSQVDITARVLAQIVLDLETSKLDCVPATLLASLIRLDAAGVSNALPAILDAHKEGVSVQPLGLQSPARSLSVPASSTESGAAGGKARKAVPAKGSTLPAAGASEIEELLRALQSRREDTAERDDVSASPGSSASVTRKPKSGGNP